MQKKTTTVKFEIRENSQARPKLSTVSLLKQFAREFTLAVKCLNRALEISFLIKNLF